MKTHEISLYETTSGKIMLHVIQSEDVDPARRETTEVTCHISHQELRKLKEVVDSIWANQFKKSYN